MTTNSELPNQVCWNDILESPFFLRYRTQCSGPYGDTTPPLELTRTCMTHDAWSNEPVECVNRICRIVCPALVPHPALNSDVWALVIEYVGTHVEVSRSCPACTPGISHYWHHAIPLPPPVAGQAIKPSPIYGPVNWYIDRFMRLHNEAIPYHGAYYARPLLDNHSGWSVVRAAFGPVTFFFILKLKILAARKVKQRYMKCILPDTSNLRSKSPNQSRLGKVLMTAVRSPARRLVIEFLVGSPPYLC
jgi:hypothetical protein